jgi:hypothetical protein
LVETVGRNQASSPPDYSTPVDNKSTIGSRHFVSLGPYLYGSPFVSGLVVSVYFSASDR